MLNLDQIKKSYPPKLQQFSLALLREYLQYKILEIIFNSAWANQVSFLGGTALRIVYNNQRFSEDLDFDNFGLSQAEFIKLSKEIKDGLTQEGCEVEIKNVFKGAFRCYIRIPGLMHQYGLSPMKSQKITIQVDTVAHNFKYEPAIFLLDRFDVYTQIKATPIDILLSQKIYAVFNRKRLKGRDFFDIDFLLNRGIKPNLMYLAKKMDILTFDELKQKIIKYFKDTDFTSLSKKVEPLLFKPELSQRVKNFLTTITKHDF